MKRGLPSFIFAALGSLLASTSSHHRHWPSSPHYHPILSNPPSVGQAAMRHLNPFSGVVGYYIQLSCFLHVDGPAHQLVEVGDDDHPREEVEHDAEADRDGQSRQGLAEDAEEDERGAQALFWLVGVGGGWRGLVRFFACSLLGPHARGWCWLVLVGVERFG